MQGYSQLRLVRNVFEVVGQPDLRIIAFQLPTESRV